MGYCRRTGVNFWRIERPLSPVASVQRAVLDGLRQVRDGEAFGSLQVSYGASHLQDTVVRASRQALLLHGPLQQPLCVLPQLAIGANLTCCHLRIRVDLLSEFAETFALAFTGRED